MASDADTGRKTPTQTQTLQLPRSLDRLSNNYELKVKSANAKSFSVDLLITI